MLDTKLLKKIHTRYDASKVFSKGRKIYYYFSAKLPDDNTYKYYLFNPQFTFTKNFEIMEQRFNDIKGYWNLYTDNQTYPKIVKNSNQVQLELF